MRQAQIPHTQNYMNWSLYMFRLFQIIKKKYQ